MADRAAETKERISLTVNGVSGFQQSGSLADLLVVLGYESSGVATALNGDFVPAAKRDGVVLKAGDQIEIVAPRQGG